MRDIRLKTQILLPSIKADSKSLVKIISNLDLDDRERLLDIDNKVVKFFNALENLDLKGLDSTKLNDLNLVISSFHHTVRKKSNAVMADIAVKQPKNTNANTVTASVQVAKTAWKDLVRSNEGPKLSKQEQENKSALANVRKQREMVLDAFFRMRTSVEKFSVEGEINPRTAVRIIESTYKLSLSLKDKKGKVERDDNLESDEINKQQKEVLDTLDKMKNGVKKFHTEGEISDKAYYSLIELIDNALYKFEEKLDETLLKNSEIGGENFREFREGRGRYF